jgi:V8-like Glu-specific endopeptidase
LALGSLAALGMSLAAVGFAHAQPAPIPHIILPADAAPESMADSFTGLQPGENPIRIDGAEWLQLRFGAFDLGPEGVLTVSDGKGESQTFTQAELAAYGGLTAYFGGDAVTVTLTAGSSAPGVTDTVAATIDEIMIGLPAAGGQEDAGGALPAPLAELLGDDIAPYLPPEPTPSPEDGPQTEAICGTDDRTRSTHPFSGRIMPIGCTGWLIQGGILLTAGHCIGAGTQFVEFNVPASNADGTTNPARTRDQYRVIATSIVRQFTGVGNDWAMFRVLPNTETGLTPSAAQGGAFRISNTANPANVRITGFGVDGPAPDFGNPPPRNADNQVQQTHRGSLTENTGGAAAGTLRYTVDTQGGNSGSPVLLDDGSNVTIGIHTNGGCTATGGTNAGTSFRNQGLWAAAGGTEDIIWQHQMGQVHYWPMLNGVRQGGSNIFSPVGAEWRLAGAGDLNGNGTSDIVWQHRNGQVHYWPMLNGVRQGGNDIFTPVGPEWTLAGAGDLNGDGTDDIVWQHRNGQVHYWPMLNGVRQGGSNVFTPVGAEWTLAGIGDVNGDGTDDLVWQHRNGQVHYWPMLNGVRQGGINVFTPVGAEWTLADVGDVNGDGTDDIVWQHRLGQVHYWPMLNGVRQGGINVFTPVGAEWRLAGVGDVD